MQPWDDSPRPDTVWTEATLQAIDPDEYDYQEFKGSLWLSRDREIVTTFLSVLSKQVSAFANGGGGRLFIGLDDDGVIDGGVPVDLKGGGTRSWLEDVVAHSVEPLLARFNVFEVRSSGPDSAIHAGHAVYVVEIPASHDAPHQSKDRRYYLRIAGKSRPMGHIHVQDVLRRTRHPRVRVARMGPYGDAERISSDPRGPKVYLCFRLFLVNESKHLAHHVGAEVVLPRAMVNSDVRTRMIDTEGLHLTQRPGELIFFRYHPTPLFPGQEIFLVKFWVALHAGNLDMVRGGGSLNWRVFADDAPPMEGQVQLSQYKVVRRSLGWLAGQAPRPGPKRPKARKRRRR